MVITMKTTAMMTMKTTTVYEPMGSYALGLRSARLVGVVFLKDTTVVSLLLSAAIDCHRE
jgi:hypothetical protein